MGLTNYSGKLNQHRRFKQQNGGSTNQNIGVQQKMGLTSTQMDLSSNGDGQISLIFRIADIFPYQSFFGGVNRTIFDSRNEFVVSRYQFHLSLFVWN